MTKSQLLELETQIDQQVRALPILSELPIRAVLSAFHMQLGRVTQEPNGEDTADRVANLGSRMSYVVSLIASMPALPFESNGSDALAAHIEIDPDFSQFADLVQYGHLCELMPEAHRDYYHCELNDVGKMRLTHASSHFADAEAEDIILSDLSIPLSVPVPSLAEAGLKRQFDHYAARLPTFDPDQMTALCAALTEHYLGAIFEFPLLTNEGFLNATRYSIGEFNRFRAAAIATGDFCQRVGASLFGRMSGSPVETERLQHEWFEWVSVNWKSEFLTEWLARLAQIDPGASEEFLRVFSLDFRPGHRRLAHAGDGFLPPFNRLGESYLFSPVTIGQFLSQRNVVYVSKEENEQSFHSSVSAHFEARLLESARIVLNEVQGLQIKTHMKWPRGELDLIALSPSENAALVVEAKSPIPPQGAKMVAHVEARSIEGLVQIRRFNALRSGDRDALLSAAFGRPLSGVSMVPVLLAYSCFGGYRVRDQAEGTVLVNLALLVRVVQEAHHEHFIKQFQGSCSTLMRELIEAASPRWDAEQLQIGSVEIEMPILRFEDAPLNGFRSRIYGRNPGRLLLTQG